MKKLLTMTEAAEELGITRDAVNRLALDGKIKVIRLDGRTVRIERVVLDSFIKLRREQAKNQVIGRPITAPPKR